MRLSAVISLEVGNVLISWKSTNPSECVRFVEVFLSLNVCNLV